MSKDLDLRLDYGEHLIELASPSHAVAMQACQETLSQSTEPGFP